MTSHAKRLQFVQKLQDADSDYAPSIISGTGSVSSNSSRGTVNKLKKNAYKPETIPEHYELSSFSEVEASLIPKSTVKYSSGPCSSIISGKSGQSYNKAGSHLSIMSGTRPISASRSLGGSKASLASAKSHKSSIQQEFHDIKVQKKINSLAYGHAKRPFRYSIICFVIGGVFFFIGLTVIMFRLYGQLFLSMDKGEIIGPIFIVSGVILLSVGIKFMVDAYRYGQLERKRLGFRAAGPNMIVLKTAPNNNVTPTTNNYVQSGSAGAQAINKVLQPEAMRAYTSTSVLR